MSSLELATLFHNTYEELVPSFGYETRKDTRVFDSESPNGKLMVAVCDTMLSELKKERFIQYIKDIGKDYGFKIENITIYD